MKQGVIGKDKQFVVKCVPTSEEVLMENKTKYRLGEMEEIISGMEFEDRCDEIVEVDDGMQILVSGWYVRLPSLSMYLRAGVACIFDEEAGMYMPDFDVTVLYEEELGSDKWIYYEQDGFVVTLGNWLNGRLPIGNIEALECYLVIPDENEPGRAVPDRK